VVITNIYLFLIPAFVFVLTGMLKAQDKPSSSGYYHITPWQWTFIALIIVITLYMLIALIRFWSADKAYSLGYNLDRSGQYKEAYPYLQKAVAAREGEPVFKDELAVNNAILAAALMGQEEAKTSTASPSLASSLAQDAITLNDFITSKHPNNIIFWKSRVRIFYALSQVNSSYLPDALQAVKKAKTLAPTDANISYNLGVLYGQNNDVKKGIKTLENTTRLKPDYRDAHYALALFYHDAAIDKDGKIINSALQKKAIAQLRYILDSIGKDDKVVRETLEQWKKL
jgi:tetratricopeptide (TPR) repeat protein